MKIQGFKIGMILCLSACCFSCSRHNVTGDLLVQKGQVTVLQGSDTLLQIPIKNGQFAFTLTPETAQYATLMINGEALASPLFVEQADFHLVQQADSSFTIEGGGELQRQEKEFATLAQAWYQKGEEFRIDMRRAGEERDIGGIMHCRA